MKKESALRKKSYEFAIRIIRLSRFLQQEQKEFILSKQVLRSGTAIGALIQEAEFAQSNADYISKFSIALKEANETVYWISLLQDTEFLDTKLSESLLIDNKVLVSMLVALIKTLKKLN